MLALLSSMPAALTGCGAGPTEHIFQGPTMGTTYHVRAFCDRPVSGIRGEVEVLLAAVNAEMSTYDENSTLSRFNRAATGDWIPVTVSLVEVVAAALELASASEGAFDPTVGPLVNLWGFGPEERRTEVPAADALARARARIGYAHLSVRHDPPALRKDARVYVDLSAIAKGYAVDRVAALLVGQGCADYLVEIGGEVRAGGRKPDGSAWRIGVEVPAPPAGNGARRGGIQRILALEDTAVATSGDYRNFFEVDGRRLSHTIDPRTGWPVEHGLASVSVVHESAMWADGYATLINVLGPEAGLRFARAEELAVLMVVKDDEGFKESMTPQLAHYSPGKRVKLPQSERGNLP